MTSIQQRDAKAVLTGIDELLPKLRERAQQTEDLRRIPPDATIAELDEVGFFKLLQPEQWGRPADRSDGLLRGGSPPGQRLRLDRLGGRHPRRAQLAYGAL